MVAARVRAYIRSPSRGFAMQNVINPRLGRCPVNPIGPSFDQHEPEFAEAAYEILDASREAARVSRSEAYGGFWVVTRYEDVKAVAHNPEVFSNCDGPAFPPLGEMAVTEMIPITLDPPELLPYRRLLTPLFSPKVMGQRSKVTDEVCNFLIDQFVQDGQADFYEQFASPLTAIVTLRFLGMDATDWEKYTKLTHFTSEKGMFPKLSEEDIAELIPEFMVGFQGFMEEAGAKLDAAEATAPEDRGESLIDRIADAEIDGEKVPRERLINMVNMVFQAGFDTTAMAFSTMLYRLGQDHELQNSLRENPDRVSDFVEESLRIESPTTLMLKTAVQDTVIGDVTIRKGDHVLISWASANRDPREFSDPTVFDIDRSPQRHTSFGLGVHRCLGSNMARNTLNIGITEILRRVTDLRVDPCEAILSRACGTVFGYRRLPGIFTPGVREGRYPDDVLSGPW